MKSRGSLDRKVGNVNSENSSHRMALVPSLMATGVKGKAHQSVRVLEI